MVGPGTKLSVPWQAAQVALPTWPRKICRPRILLRREIGEVYGDAAVIFGARRDDGANKLRQCTRDTIGGDFRRPNVWVNRLV